MMKKTPTLSSSIWTPDTQLLKNLKDSEIADLFAKVLNHKPYSTIHLSDAAYKLLGTQAKNALYDAKNKNNINIQIDGTFNNIHFDVFNPIWATAGTGWLGIGSKTPTGITEMQEELKKQDKNELQMLLAIHSIMKNSLNKKSKRAENVSELYKKIFEQTQFLVLLEQEEKSIRETMTEFANDFSIDSEKLILQCAQYGFNLPNEETKTLKNIFEEKRMQLIELCKETIKEKDSVKSLLEDSICHKENKMGNTFTEIVVKNLETPCEYPTKIHLNIKEDDLDRAWFLVNKILFPNPKLFKQWKKIEPQAIHEIINGLKKVEAPSKEDLLDLEKAERLLQGAQITIYVHPKKLTQEEAEQYAVIFKEISDILKKNNILPADTLDSDIRIDSYISLRRDKDENGNYVKAIEQKEKSMELKKLAEFDLLTLAIKKYFETSKQEKYERRQSVIPLHKKSLHLQNTSSIEENIKSPLPKTPEKPSE